MSFTDRALSLTDRDPVRAEALKQAVLDSIKSAHLAKAAGYTFAGKQGVVNPRQAYMADMIAKGATPDTVKEWDVSNPIANTPIQNTGITPYSLESALLHVYPKDLTVRNTAARQKGIGQGFEFRRITSVTNSSYNVNTSPFFVSTGNTVSVNGTTLNRPPNIGYTGDATFLPYVEMGWSDEVALRLIYAAEGYSDAQAESMLALLNAHLLGEEKALLMSRSNALSVSGVTVAAAQSTHTTSGSGLPAIATSSPVLVCFYSGLGLSQAVATTISTLSAGYGIDITVTGTIPAGTVGIAVFVTTGGSTYKGQTALLNGNSPTTFAVYTATTPSSAADNGSNPAYTLGGTLISGATSSSVVGYNGMIAEFANAATAGYVSTLNAAVSTTSPGTEWETALDTLYVQQGADPEMILWTGGVATAVWEAVKTQSTNGGYRINLTSGEGATIGSAVAGITNPATQTVCKTVVHRYLPAGVSLIYSPRVPWADSNVSSTLKVVNAVDTMVINWPEIGMSRDASTYTYGTACFEVPALSGAIIGINN